MSDAWNEDEWVAAFLDGRLDERQRAEMLSRLTTDHAAYEHFAATAAILREAEEAEKAEVGAAADANGAAALPAGAPTLAGASTDATPERTAGEDGAVTLPSSPPAGAPVPVSVLSADAPDARKPEPDRGVTPLHPKKPATAVRLLALAAGIATLALVGRTLWPRPLPAEGPMHLALRLEHADQGLPTANWNDPPPWSSSRGDELPADLSPEEKAVEAARAGTLLMDLSVAVRAEDTVATRLFARRIASRYDPEGLNGGLRDVVEGAGAAPERLQPRVEQATDRIAKRLQREPLELGAWTEAARLAAERHDSTFFRDPQTGPTLDRLAATKPSARAAVDRVRVLLPDANPLQQWDDLAAALKVLLREIASE